MACKGPIRMNQAIKNLALSNKRKRSGSALILTVLVVLISLAIGTGLLAMGTNARISSMRKVQSISARSAADAGIEHAVQTINDAVEAGHWSGWVIPHYENVWLYDEDTYYSVQSAYSVSDGYQLQSVGRHQNQTHTVSASLRLKGLFENAIMCRNGITLKNGTVISSVDSDVSMDPDDTDEQVVIGTNSTGADSITLNNGVTVEGDIVVGVGGDTDTIIKDLGATVDEKYSLTSSFDFPSVSPPSFRWPNISIGVKKGEKKIGPWWCDYPAVGRFSNMDLSNGTTLRVVGDCTLYITGDVDMGQSSEIILEAGASLTIYLDGDWISDNNSGINNTSTDTSSFTLYGTGPAGQKIDLKAKSNFYGSIYAPDADLTIYSGGDLYGAFVADNFELKNPARFYYDAALKSVHTSDEGARYVISRWNEQ